MPEDDSLTIKLEGTEVFFGLKRRLVSTTSRLKVCGGSLGLVFLASWLAVTGQLVRESSYIYCGPKDHF
jgi:hypothetical protein